jgi:hypothetical protein
MSDYRLCSWKVRSELPLPELLPWTGDAARPADIDIVVGEVPPPPPAPVFSSPFTQIDAEGRARLDVAGVAAFLVTGGNRIVVAPRIAGDSPDIGLFLLGSAFGFLCHQRELVPLHAACLEIDGRAIAFAGPSGAGKSTLAASLIARGHRLLADDVTVIDPAGGGATVLPSFPRMKLWRDSLDALGLEPGRRLRSKEELEKFEHRVPASAFRADDIPLAMVCHLRAAPASGMREPYRLTGVSAVDMVRQNIYRRRILKAMAGPAALSHRAEALAAAAAQVMLYRPVNFAEAEGFASGLPDLLRRV